MNPFCCKINILKSYLFVLLLLLPVLIQSQNWFNFAGMPLRLNSIGLSTVKKVGGVMFESVAFPEEGLFIDSLELFYDDSKEDGNRVSIKIHYPDSFDTYKIEIPDWQLLPIVDYSESDSSVLVSMYGQNMDPSYPPIYLHSAINNTLLGARLLQADLLFAEMEDEVGLLSFLKIDSTSSLGVGEDKYLSRMGACKKCFEEVKKLRDLQQTDSYILFDRDIEVSYSFKNGKIYITGEPYYLFNSTTIKNNSYIDYIHDKIKELRQVDTSRLARSPRVDEIEKIILGERYSWSDEEIREIIDQLYYIYVESIYLEKIKKELRNTKIPRSKEWQYPFREIKELQNFVEVDTSMMIKEKIDSLYAIEKDRTYHISIDGYYSEWNKIWRSRKLRESYTHHEVVWAR